MKTMYDIVRKAIDNCLVKALNDNSKGGIISFHELFTKICADLNIGIASFKGTDVLTVYGEDAFKKIHAIYYYLMDLEKNSYLLYVDLPDSVEDINFGDAFQTNNGRLSVILSAFIRAHDGYNLCISPSLLEYVNALHSSSELFEARKQSRIALVAAILSGIATLIAILSLILPHCPH